MPARFGWKSAFPEFRDTPPNVVRERLAGAYVDPTPEQVDAWDQSIGPLQREIAEVVAGDAAAVSYSTLLEYELPLDFRRPDVLLLVSGGVVVVELKGKRAASQADIDQVAAYARDLRCYHRHCEGRSVIPVLVPTRARGRLSVRDGVHVVGPDALDEVVRELNDGEPGSVIPADEFVADTAYRPLPTLVEAARTLFETQDLPEVKRATAATTPSLERITQIIRTAAEQGDRRLVFVTGVPGAGKTLVGLSLVHARWLDALSVPRAGYRPTAPAIFLSGNKPLVEVLQYQLKAAGGGGQTFVRHVKQYVQRYAVRDVAPDHHVIVFDEAQRAHDAATVASNHNRVQGFPRGKSEPQLFLEFAGRVPTWSTLVCLFGTGQEIHVGEEGGLRLWNQALRSLDRQERWHVHGPEAMRTVVEGTAVAFEADQALSLNTAVRFHLVADVAQFVEGLLAVEQPASLATLAQRLETEGYHLRVTRSLDDAKSYLRDRYQHNRRARFGLLASSRDGTLASFNVPNDQSVVRAVRTGPWFVDDEDHFKGLSGRHLRSCLTEFQVQGLELDGALLAWGTDFLLSGNNWTSGEGRRYRSNAGVVDPHRLRLNSYRVLLTRAREVVVVFVPPLSGLDETYEYLVAAGFKQLT